MSYHQTGHKKSQKESPDRQKKNTNQSETIFEGGDTLLDTVDNRNALDTE